MKLAIDCRSLRRAPSGIPNFLIIAINQIALNYPEWNIVLLSNQDFHDYYKSKLPNKANVEVVISPLLFFKNVSILWLCFKAGTLMKSIKPDLYWGPAFLLPPFLPKKIKTLVTVHDVVVKEYAGTMSFLGKLYAYCFQDTSINKADYLWANSKYTAKAVEKHYPNRKCSAVLNGFFINTKLFKPLLISEEQKNRILAKYNLDKNFFIFVGTLEPRKNLHFLLTLIPYLTHLNYKLLIVGAKGWGNTQIHDFLSQSNYPREYIELPGFVETNDLVQLYNLASIYISTSLNEGFGMPQLEAMACGCPVVSPHNSAMVEVVEGAGETVLTWEINDWVKAVEKVLSNRAYYINRGFDRVKEYDAKLVIQNIFDSINYSDKH